MFTDGSRLDDGAAGYAVVWKSGQTWKLRSVLSLLLEAIELHMRMQSTSNRMRWCEFSLCVVTIFWLLVGYQIIRTRVSHQEVTSTGKYSIPAIFLRLFQSPGTTGTI